MATGKELSPLLIASRGKTVSLSSAAGLFRFAKLPPVYLETATQWKIYSVSFASTYSSSKAAVLAYSDVLRLELAPFGRAHSFAMYMPRCSESHNRNVQVTAVCFFISESRSLNTYI